MSSKRAALQDSMAGEPLASGVAVAPAGQVARAEEPPAAAEGARLSCWEKLQRSLRYNSLRLLRVKDSSERVARGFALGLIINFFPTFGFGVLISGFVARLFGGNAVAGFVGGATLTFAWPILFYLNMQVGGLAFVPKIKVEQLDDVTERAVDALVWGKTFFVGAVANSLVVGLAVYVSLRLAHRHFRPHLLARLRRPRLRPSAEG